MSSRQRLRLIRQLRAAHESLHAWERSLRHARNADAAESSGAEQSLLALFNDAKRRVDRRLVELGESRSTPQPDLSVTTNDERLQRDPVVTPHRPHHRARKPETLGVKACRACGQALGAAYREAQSVADTASVRSLYGSLREFEKHLWILDPLQAG